MKLAVLLEKKEYLPSVSIYKSLFEMVLCHVFMKQLTRGRRFAKSGHTGGVAAWCSGHHHRQQN
jgi:hypothetical protein